ncbi:hypothetical protein [Streptomyces uncialis]|uniref:hypothetical protein n=1 Tax=Streptomyces uncialis TaxID=1048205 RepID=UPI00386EBA09|nr:hypothetical protein OG924_28900 [Streptomyces uncialis]
MISDVPPGDGLDALVAALPPERNMVVLAPHGTVNTGVVTGGQRQTVTAAMGGGPAAGTTRQGPVRAKDLRTARRRFMPPPGFESALTALDSGVSVLVGAPGTGRETHALNLLAHGREDPMLLQVDGSVDLTRWAPRSQGVHGYLVMEPPDPFALRPWDLSRLEAPLAEAGAHLLIVLADAPGLASDLANRLGTPVVRHLPPDPRQVFAAHLADICSDEEVRGRLLRSLGAGHFQELLPAELPPRQAARVARAVARLGAAGGADCAEVLDALARAEAPDLVARAQEDPVLLAHLLALSVYGGLDRDSVVERASDLLELAGSGGEREAAAPRLSSRPDRPPQGTAPQRPLSETLRTLGAHRTSRAGTGDPDTLSFFWPAVGDAVWRVLCREHGELLPLLHTWLARTGDRPDQVERAGRAVAAMAAGTDGRTLDLLPGVASAPWPAAVEVAARGLGTALRDPASAAGAAELLERWSAAPETALRRAVAYACRSDSGVTTAQALLLAHQLMETTGGGTDEVTVAFAVVDALVQRFATGDTRTRGIVLERMRAWAGSDDLSELIAALAFPAMAGADPAWCGGRMLTGGEAASALVRLTGHALNEAATFASMRDVLLSWCREADGTPRPDPGLEELLNALTEARQPGFLRWLMAVARGHDAMPGKETAARLLTVWHGRAATPDTDTNTDTNTD